jgi:hypothetical protein
MKPTATLIAAIALLAGCTQGTVTESSANRRLRAASATVAQRDLGPDVQRDLATLRRVTASFHDFETASRSGWSAQITPCMADPAGAGGMGFHYGNTHLIDGTAHVDRPQLLLYEPEQNGRLRLVAVEYIIPYTFHSRDAEPPRLFGQQFQQNDTFQLWGLHAWVWEENPSGVFANWNPRVGCEHTTDVSRMTH